jgi:imidazolonepropionase-like amidohydrolase
MRFIALALLLGCAGSQKPAVTRATFAIRDVRVFDGQRVIPRATVLVDGATIVGVGDGLAIPPGTQVIEGAGKTLLPGLFDAHAHVFDASQLEQSLAFGVTTVLDMFSDPKAAGALRDKPAADRADLRTAGTLATSPKGHGTEYGFPIPTITSPDQAQAFVDARFAEGSDYLKIVFDGGGAYGIKTETISQPTLDALIKAAHARHKLAVVHIGSLDEAKAAIDGGADGIVHTFRDRVPDADLGRWIAGKHAFVTPTLSVLRTLEGVTSKLGDAPEIAPYLDPGAKSVLAGLPKFKVAPVAGVFDKTIAELRDAGVPVLVGTDAPNSGTTFGVSVHEELGLLVAAGLPATTALAGATSLPAERFGLRDRGRIATGMRADLLLVDGDPTQTIGDTRKIVAIWHLGAKFDRDGYRAKIAELGKPIGPGMVSDFEHGLKPRIGQPWFVSTDELVKGTSTATLTVVDGALEIAGTVVAHQPASWAGAMLSPGARMFAPVDLTATTGLQFTAKGDGKTYMVMVFTESKGAMPSMKTFTAGTTASVHTFTWADFEGVSPKDISGIWIGATLPGAFKLVIDNVELK